MATAIEKAGIPVVQITAVSSVSKYLTSLLPVSSFSDRILPWAPFGDDFLHRCAVFQFDPIVKESEKADFLHGFPCISGTGPGG